MRKDSSVLFIGDNRSKLYHNKLCEAVFKINNKDIRAFTRDSNMSGYIPCRYCHPDATSIRKLESKSKSRHDMIKSRIMKLCRKNDLEVATLGSTAYIKSLTGDWKFNFDKTIEYILYYKKEGEENYSVYSINEDINSPIKLLEYIIRKDNQDTKLNIGRFEQLRIKRLNGNNVLACNDYVVASGQQVVALFPFGLKECTIGKKENSSGYDYYFFEESEYSKYSPVGMFVQVYESNGIPIKHFIKGE